MRKRLAKSAPALNRPSSPWSARRGRPARPAETVGGAEHRMTRRALRREPLVQSRRPGQIATIEQAVMFGFGREHALDFHENQSVVATRLDDICAPFGLGAAQRRFEYLP